MENIFLLHEKRRDLATGFFFNSVYDISRATGLSYADKRKILTVGGCNKGGCLPKSLCTL